MPDGPQPPPEFDHWRAGCGESSPVRFGKRPTEKDPNHRHLAGGLLHSEAAPARQRAGATRPQPARSLRPTKTQQKISGRLTSAEITQDRLDIRAYIDTLRKHGTDVLIGIRNALTGNPWRPPIPAPT